MSANGDVYTTSPSFNNPSTYELRVPTLSEIAEILQNTMQSRFDELKIDVANCPCLTREPFNLVGVGLCGNPTLFEIGGYSMNNQNPWRDDAWNIKELLSKTCYDSFIIGTGYAAKPHMPYNGHLIMNAIYKAPDNITNMSRIVFANTGNGQRRIETLTEPDQMICSFMGNFFISEGREGNVLRMRAKGRKYHEVDIISTMQVILYENFYKHRKLIIALGGVLRMRNGKVAHNIMPEEYPQPMSSFYNFFKQFQCHEIDLESDLVAVGTIVNYKPQLLVAEQRYGVYASNKRHQFHSFSDYGAGGQFFSDTTPDMTEYEGYFNLAKKVSFLDSYE